MFLNHDLWLFRTTADYNYILSYKLILPSILWFALNLFFCAEERLPSQVVWSASKDTNVSSMAATREFYERENKWKCTEPERERMSDDLMELNDTELNHMHFGDETDSDNASNYSDIDFVAKKAYFILNSLPQFELLRVFKSYILPWKYILYFQMWSFYAVDWNVCFVFM